MVVLTPSPEAIKEIHATFIRQYGIDGYMSEGMVEGCLERAMTYVYNFKPFPKLFVKAAAILYSFIVFHPFVDGNKRTAFQTTRMFLHLNGYELTVDPEEGFQFTRAIADQKITDIVEIVKWLRQHSKRKLRYLVSCFFLKFSLLSVSGTSKKELQKFPRSFLLLLHAVRLYPD